MLSEGLLEIFLKLHHNLSTPLNFLSNQVTSNNSRVTKLASEKALLRPHRYWGNLSFDEFQRKIIPSLLLSVELDYQTQGSGFNQEYLREVFTSTNGIFQNIINVVSKIGTHIETMNEPQNTNQIYLEVEHRYKSAKKLIAQKATHNKYLSISERLEEIYLKELYADTFPKEGYPALAVERHFSHPGNLPNLMFLHRILKTDLSLNPEFDLAHGIDFEDSFARYVKSTRKLREKPMSRHEYWINYYSMLDINLLLNRMEVSDQIWVIDDAICPGCGKRILTLSEDGRICHFEIGENNVLSTIYSLLLKKLNLNIRWQQSKYIMTIPKSLHWPEQTPDINGMFNLFNHGTLFEYKKETTCEILNDWLSLHICCTNNNFSALELIFYQFVKHQMATNNPLDLENKLLAKHKTMIAKFGKVRADVFVPEFAELLNIENIELLNPEMISTKNFKFRPTHDICPFINSEVVIKSGVDIIGEPYGYVYSQAGE